MFIAISWNNSADMVLQHLKQLFMESSDKYFHSTYLENINYHQSFHLTKAVQWLRAQALKWGWCGFESQPRPSLDIWPQAGHSPSLRPSFLVLPEKMLVKNIVHYLITVEFLDCPTQVRNEIGLHFSSQVANYQRKLLFIQKLLLLQLFR